MIGADNYETLAKLTGFDVFDRPEILLDPKTALECGVADFVMRGSQTSLDWVRDFRALAMPTRIGHAHVGFFDGMDHMWSDLKAMLDQPAVITGHSLGAARAGILTALMVANSALPLARVVFGEPKPGFLDLAHLVTRVPGRSYRNGDELHHDLVTDVPFSFPPPQYVHPTPILPVCCRQQGDAFAQLGVFT